MAMAGTPIGSVSRQNIEDVVVGAAVDLCGLIQLLRDLGEEALENVHREGKLNRDVHQGEARPRVEGTIIHQDLEQRDDGHLGREDDGAEDEEV